MGSPENSQQIAHEESAFLATLEREMSQFFSEQERILEEISAEALPLLTSIKNLSIGGKRLRALLAYWGWRAAGGAAESAEIVRAGAAIELFQTAALIHDDIIDRSDTRRGAPSVHKQFESQHEQSQWRTDGAIFGISSAIIAGDLCLSWSEQMFSSIGTAATSGHKARAIFDLMRTEVMAGQYLDILGEVVGAEENTAAVARARNVIRYKSAKYSCEHPLVLGGALALNAHTDHESELLEDFAAFALPLGEAFQMRDDVLGVFGETSLTGKPAGDDLREGKRTLLIATTEKLVAPEQWQKLDAALGKENLSVENIAELQAIIADSGALSTLESEIEETGNQVSARLFTMPIDELSRNALKNIVDRLLHRAS